LSPNSYFWQNRARVWFGAGLIGSTSDGHDQDLGRFGRRPEPSRPRARVQILQVLPPSQPVPAHRGQAVGVDMGLYHLLTLSDGTAVENPRWSRQSLAKLRVSQRQMSRRKKGSDRRRKAGAQVVTVNRAYTSQVCAGCGVIVEKYPGVCVHQCPDCGVTADRDVNAALNITRLAIKPALTGAGRAQRGRLRRVCPEKLPAKAGRVATSSPDVVQDVI
jgi:transposase